MIKIEAIHIHEFRGIRDLSLEFKGENFAACGPNGTGKSGIVDAIDFVLTGNISRLSGKGTGELSVKDHGPHVDSRNKPEQAFVELTVSILSSVGKKATIRRSIGSANTPIITPSDVNVKFVFDHIKNHPEFVLSRRQLIQYILSEPGERSKEIQALLRLEEIEKLRASLQKISNSCNRDLPALERAQKDGADQLKSALNVTELSKILILEAVNSQREFLGLSVLTELDAKTSLKEGLINTLGSAQTSKVAKVQASADLIALRKAFDNLRSSEFIALCTAAITAVNDLEIDSASVNGVSRETLLHKALELFDDKVCPVCDTQFDSEHFRKHVAEKLKNLDHVTAKRKALEAMISPIMDAIHTAEISLVPMIKYGPLLNPAVDIASLDEVKLLLLGRYKQLEKLLPLSDTRSILSACHKIPDMIGVFEALGAGIAILPEPTKQDAAREFLILAQERLEKYRESKKKYSIAKMYSVRASKVYEIYGDVVKSELERIYKEVEEKFSIYYRKMNHHDESEFTAKLSPTNGKLGFGVDFYGRGHFPPGAYHSEGHQDGMGLCLYLALMHYLLGKNFTFAVLDDVLMSIDVGHRREVCALLKEHFPNTQFIFTTHDTIWLQHMKSEGLIKGRNCAHFRTWHVDVGPKEWDNHDIWNEISILLERNDVRGAAALLRHYLEYFAAEACDRLRASVEFQGDGQFPLGDILSGSTSELGKIFKMAKAAANSWNQQNVVDMIAVQEDAFADVKKRINCDKWQLNASVHFNEWNNLQKSEFEPLVAAFKDFSKMFVCPSCQEMYYVTPAYEQREGFRCGCGIMNLNLRQRVNEK